MAWNRFNSLLKNFSLKIRNQCFLGRHNTICTSMFFVHFFCNFYNGTWWWNSLFSLMSLVVQDSRPLLQISIGKLSLKNWPKIMVPFSYYLSVAMFQIISQLITQKKSIIQLTVFGISSSFSYFFTFSRRYKHIHPIS